MNNNQLQQGDVCLEYVSSIPSGAQKTTNKVLRHGESGNKHQLIGECDLFEFEKSKYIVTGSGEVKVMHGQHTVSTLRPNSIVKLLDGVFEYDYEKEEAKRVID